MGGCVVIAAEAGHDALVRAGARFERGLPVEHFHAEAA
jgi:hypothetical protein